MPIKGIGQGTAYDQIRIQQEQERAKNGPEGVKTSTVKDNDGVTVSENARLRSVAYKAAAGADDMRQDRVAALKAMVDNGEYQVDSRDIARRMVAEELDMSD